MGDFRVRSITDKADHRKAYLSHLDDLAAFEMMLEEGLFDEGPAWIGAEQELCLVGKDYQASTTALEVLDRIKDPRYTNELALYNLEANLDPLPLGGSCFRETEEQLLGLLDIGQAAAGSQEARILQCGILPTLKYRNLQFENMTPEPRYKTLSASLKALRGEDFQIYLQGADDLITSLNSVLFEACNTSFQLHLQIPSRDFVRQHNWSQMIAGPVLAACVNSPLLFGRELWAETRIAIFKQSLDTRSSSRNLRSKMARVYFGQDWLHHSAAEIWRNNLSRFPLLLTSDGFERATDVVRAGGTPKLRAVRLQNGTTYTWNRLCYGPTSPKPHLRIECRYIPAGPSTLDEIANFAFWTGLMQGNDLEKGLLPERVDFKSVRDNFVKAARTGLGTTFDWFGRLRTAKSLLLDTLIPQARVGLERSGVDTRDIEKYLGVIHHRVTGETTGSSWTVRNFRSLEKAHGTAAAETALVRMMLEYQRENLPVHEWQDYRQSFPVSLNSENTVEYLMTRDVFAVNHNDCIERAEMIMNWNNIHHLPVENDEGELVGLLTDGLLRRHREGSNDKEYVAEIMLRDLETVGPETSLGRLRQIMLSGRFSGLPVVCDKKMVGMITERDLALLQPDDGREIQQV
ncbi:CBS domain-containing protein [Lewinella sp. W8]|uniref:CBS domain-containing protein n=1 Tax=Lewinella sp. W8 TaxID=2528208 RepID=UPI00106838BA|nr:CBS domain-containing protein [Lewinella sp. W8]MTB53556.1 CBS domain-containing protein [Lewinella sp. W8]